MPAMTYEYFRPTFHRWNYKVYFDRIIYSVSNNCYGYTKDRRDDWIIVDPGLQPRGEYEKIYNAQTTHEEEVIPRKSSGRTTEKGYGFRFCVASD